MTAIKVGSFVTPKRGSAAVRLGMLTEGAYYEVREVDEEFARLFLPHNRYNCGARQHSGICFQELELLAPAQFVSQAPEPPPMILSEDAKERKGTPITTGVLDYFPRALAAVAQCSKAGNDQHNPGQPLHWDKSKSTDHADCIARHLIDRDSIDTDGIAHAAKLAWRALALLEIKLSEAQNGEQ